jgi:hypothetical protein
MHNSSQSSTPRTSAALLLWIWLVVMSASFVAAVLLSASWRWGPTEIATTIGIAAGIAIGALLLWRWTQRFGPIRWKPFLVSVFLTTLVLVPLNWTLYHSWRGAIASALLTSWFAMTFPWHLRRNSATSHSFHRA